ncbi:TetR family transcriptional regulator [bacterium]|jgi:AcrR family transcriptional regulator|nr:TetR family transcriptional regulator [bacterium]
MGAGATPTGAVEPGRHDKEGRKQALVDAALRTFAGRGYEAATTREIADMAGCSEGLIHRYFGGKRGLLWAALAQKHEDTALRLGGVAQTATTAEEAIEGILLQFVDMFGLRQQLFRVVMSRCMVDAEEGVEYGEMIREKQAGALAEYFEPLVERGILRADVDIEALAEAVRDVAFMLGFMQLVVFGMDRQAVEVKARAVARMLAAGVAGG